VEEVRKVTSYLGQESVYISGKEDASKRRAFDYPGLRILVAQRQDLHLLVPVAHRKKPQ
jgi:hypothetical protein